MSAKKPDDGISPSWLVRQPGFERVYKRMVRGEGGHVDPKLRGVLSDARDDEAAQREATAVRERDEAIAKAAPFANGRPPVPTKQMQYIRNLVVANPKLYPRQLWDIHEPTKIIPMTERNFLKRASEIRGEMRKEKINISR